MTTSNPDITTLRMFLAEPHEPLGTSADPGKTLVGYLFSDDQLQILIDYAGGLLRAAQLGWATKAGYLQPLIDVDESGVSRRMSQLYKQAGDQAEIFKNLADEQDANLVASVRIVGVPSSPWGRQLIYGPGNVSRTYLIGDVSRAGAGGSIIFIEVPVVELVELPQGSPPVDEEPLPQLPVVQVIVPTAESWPMVIEKGRSFTFTMDYRDPTSGLQVNLTGWTATLIADDPQTGDRVLHVGSGMPDPGSLLIDVPGSRFVLHFMPDDTSAFAFSIADYEVVAVGPDANSYTLLRGNMTIITGDV